LCQIDRDFAHSVVTLVVGSEQSVELCATLLEKFLNLMQVVTDNAIIGAEGVVEVLFHLLQVFKHFLVYHKPLNNFQI
jgi:hypothetical protein